MRHAIGEFSIGCRVFSSGNSGELVLWRSVCVATEKQEGHVILSRASRLFQRAIGDSSGLKGLWDRVDVYSTCFISFKRDKACFEVYLAVACTSKRKIGEE